MPTFSVIIPTYNRASEVVSALESVLAQTYSDFDVWVVDDGSTDKTAEALAPFGAAINYVRTPNRGHAAARNRGIQDSRGRYTAFLDSDDRWYPEKLERVAGVAAKNPQVGLFYTDVVAVNATRERLWVQRAPDADGNSYLRLLGGNFITISSAITSRKALERSGLFDETFRLSPDWDLWLRIARLFPVQRVPYAATEYCALGTGSQSADASEAWGDELRRVVEKALAADPEIRASDRRRARAGMHYAIGRTTLLQGEFTRARRELLEALLLRPTSWKAVVYFGAAATRGAHFLPQGLRRRLRFPDA
jgi:glycosyltransferase involved in cell wall biosynthesis